MSTNRLSTEETAQPVPDLAPGETSPSLWSARRGRRRIVVLLAVLGALVIAVPIVIWAVVGGRDRSPESVPAPTGGPVVSATLPASPVPSQAASTGASAQPSEQTVLPRHYTAVSLPRLSDSDQHPTIAFALNDRGQVVGQSDARNGHAHPVLWQGGKITDLGVLDPGSGDELGIARDINNNGDIVGGSDGPDGQRAVLWRNGQIIDLGTLDGNPTFAYAINDKGQVVGTSYTPAGELRGFLWENGRMRDLGIDGGVIPWDINNNGQVVGVLDFGPSGARTHAFSWENGVVTRLSAPGISSSARAINDRGEIVGRYVLDIEVSSQPVRWYHGSMTELGLLGKGSDGGADAITENGLILGGSNIEPHSAEAHPFLWWRGGLHDLVPAGIPGEYTAPLDINNRGQILCGLLFTPA